MSGLNRSLLLGLGLGLVVVIAMMILSDARALGDALTSIDVVWLAPVLGLSLLGYGLRILKWELYLRRLDVRLGPGESALCFVAGMVMSITPGKVGEVLKSFLLREARGIPVARTAPIVVAERLTDLIALLLLATWGAATLAYGVGILLVGGALVATLLLLIAWPEAGRLAVRLTARLPLVGGLAPRLEEARESMASLVGPRMLAATTALSLLAWGGESVGTWLVISAFPGTTATLGEATFVYAFATVAGALSMLPGGMVATEGSMVALLVVVLAVVPNEQVATAVTLLVRFTTLWLGVGLGAWALWLFRRRYVPAAAAPAEAGS